MNIEKLREEIKAKQAEVGIKQSEIDIANDCIYQRKQAIAEFICPFTVGQKVKSD